LKAPFTKEQADQARSEWAKYLNVPERKQLDLPKGLKLDLVLVPPGKFRMGHVGNKKDEAAHQVAISKPFYIAETETTQEQYEAVMGKNPSGFSAKGKNAHRLGLILDTSKFPVENVNWKMASEFCKSIDAQLPTEAQWEYACRAGTITDFHFGNSLSGMNANFAWTKPQGAADESTDRTTAVKSYPPNAFGLYDMHGNVAEWCRDWYAEKTDDLGEIHPERAVRLSEDRHVMRGGSWSYTASSCRSSYRGLMFAPGLRNYYNNGFRVIVALP
jgi:formylglycine-generating enzyme required for sulfatase activity